MISVIQIEYSLHLCNKYNYFHIKYNKIIFYTGLYTK